MYLLDSNVSTFENRKKTVRNPSPQFCSALHTIIQIIPKDFKYSL